MQANFTLAQRSVFWGKSRLLIANRMLRNGLPRRVKRAVGGTDVLLAEDSSPLYSAIDPRERALMLGKIENLRIAARRLNGVVLRKGDIFSFWRIVGRPTRTKGFVVGRELRQGCIIPTIAGGICQLSNALSRTALRAGMEITERHAHTALVEGIDFDPETDATLFWNYLDFRFRATMPVQLSVNLTATDLIVALHRQP
jgi:vancomycin resistance protein YoaR